MPSLLVSVIIPTHNRKELLVRCLDSLAAQTIKASQLEVIVVDDGSTDGTGDLLKGKKYSFQLKYLRIERTGPPNARNVGTKHASGEIVAFMDDDVVCHADCIERAIPCFSQDNVAAVETNLLLEGTDRPLLKRSAVQGFITAAIFFRRQVLIEIGGFDEDFFDHHTGVFFRDDSDLGFRLLEAGYDAVQPEEVKAWHPMIFGTIASCFAHARRYMFDPLLYRKHPRLFRSRLERKRIGPFSFGRPMHYGCECYCAAVSAGGMALGMGFPSLAVICAALAVLPYFVVRFKFQGRQALQIWKLHHTLAFALLPWWYIYWFVRGCIKFDGCKSLV